MTETILTWLRTLYARSPGFFTVIAFHNGKPKAVKWYATDAKSLRRAARTIEAHAEKYDMYVSVATHREVADNERRRGGITTVTSIPGFWADIDIGTEGHRPAALPNPTTVDEALSILDGLPEPSTVIHSGGGLQVWWLFDEPWVFDNPSDAAVASDDWSRLLIERGNSKGYHVDKVGDLPRILRVPGTFNHKTDTLRSVTILKPLLDDAIYSKDLVCSLGVPAEDIAHESTEDTFPLSWEEILGPHGYTFAGTDSSSGGLRVVRPGKTASQGISGIASPYGVPVLVNHSSSDPVLPSGPGQKLTKLRVYALLNFDGNMSRAKAAISRLVKDTPEEIAKLAAQFAHSRVNWPQLWTEEVPEPEWLCEPLIERGRQIAIYSGAKVGKTLLMWEIAAALSSGRSVLGNDAREPINVLYIDRENTKKDLREKLAKMGYENDPLPNLHYYLFPELAWLDTEEGARELHALAVHHRADLVIVDTLSRVIVGTENENDSFLNFYKYTGVTFKAEGITLLRLDHSGKDESKGMRGGSAKTTDVDDVWRINGDDNILTLTRTHSRANHGDGSLLLSRRDTPTLHHQTLSERGEATMYDAFPSLLGDSI